jgi:Tfp pilus assembly protein PilN
MIEINLLPWRAELRYKKTRKIKFFCAFCGGFFILWIVIHFIFEWVLHEYNSVILELQNQSTELRSQDTENHPDPAQLIWQQIHLSQNEMINFFKALEKTSSTYVSWIKLVNQGDKMKLKGETDSIKTLTSFVYAYNAINHYLSLNIESIKIIPHLTALEFTLQTTYSSPALLKQLKKIKND